MRRYITWAELVEMKRRSREADAKALADGTKTREQLSRENAFLPGRGAKIDWSRVGKIR